MHGQLHDWRVLFSEKGLFLAIRSTTGCTPELFWKMAVKRNVEISAGSRSLYTVYR